MILRGLDEQVVMTSPIKGLFWNMFRTERTSSATFKRCVLSGRSSLCWYYLAFWSTRFDIMSSGVAVLTSLLISLNFTVVCFYTPTLNKICIYLYTDLQMAMLKSAIASGTVIGIDRTFNLSSGFLTPLRPLLPKC
jgi:hypothetical protein